VRWRQAWLRLHRWLGLALGAWFVLMGLTGSLLVFYPTLDRALNPQIAVAAQCRAPDRWQPVLDALQAAEPGLSGRWRLELPRDPGIPVYARYHDSVAAARLHAPLLFTVDPCTLQVVRRGRWGDTLMTFIYDLHYQLLLQAPGRELVGWGGVLLLVSLTSGLILWWPRRRWWPALRPQWRRGSARGTWDLHTRGGLYGLPLLGLLTLTGVLLAWPARVEPWVAALSDVRAAPATAVEARDEPRISADQAMDVARRALPAAEPRWLDTPDGAAGSYRIRLRQPGEPGNRFPHSYVWVDPYDGRVLALRDAQHRSSGEAFLAWLHPLHDGEALGLAGRWLVLLGGLLPVLLMGTGWLRWRQKQRGDPLRRGSSVPPQR
jgi:uncharacterized iron-regulated membrane protein